MDNGNVTALAFVVSSSKEIKENITPVSAGEAIGVLENLRPVSFNYKAEGAARAHIGFIAEDVPEAAAAPDKKGISIVDVVAILTRVVKEQQQTIKSLVERTQMLESRDQRSLRAGM